ncbi:hypothetical protein [Polaromonas sp. A23]|uniref:hypothetical protein n=1 Tax=Polaromonas sp. A23 TaxID=1944133 RepID=UPI000985E6B7|nr:hypothetical protein [Polaromonas sp. A23]OOG39824.1 hypothetical protein B0B52_14465 [Polaromonas sp. A23]
MHIARRVLLALAMGVLVLCSWLAPMDAPAMEQVDAGLKRALISFATARVLNAAISVAQGTEALVQPFGVGVTLAPGQVLDPVNDLVEQFSNLMLAASVVFGVQKVLIGIGAYWPISLVLTVAALGWSWLYWRGQHPPAWLSRTLVIVLMLRFAVPVVTIGTDLLWQKFLAADYQASQQLIDSASGRVDKLNPVEPAGPGNLSLLDKMKNWLAKNADVKQHFDDLKQAAEQATEHIIKLIVIFLLQTLVIPLALLWAMYGLVRRVFEWPGRPVLQGKLASGP